MEKSLLAFDMSSYLWRGLLAGKDDENGYKVMHNDKEVHINSAEYGYENVLSLMLRAMEATHVTPVNVILVIEGVGSKSKRQVINSTYKAGDSRAPEMYEEFQKCREMLRTTFLELGSQVMTQDYAEGDDVLAYLAQHTKRYLTIATYDNDLAALYGKNEHGAHIDVLINGEVGVNKYGPFAHHLITTYKALVGDSSDNIKGCPGFGEAAFQKFMLQYGDEGMQEFQDMLARSDLSPIADMIEDPDHKLLKKVWEKAPEVLNSFNLAKLRPEWVNTMQNPLQWQAGKVRPLQPNDDPRLRKWYGAVRLVTAETFVDACKWARTKIAISEFVALDIETSTPDESDAWLVEQGKKEGVGVDVYGSYLVGLGLTFGDNNQYTLYFSVKHAETNNIDSETLRQFIAEIDKPLVIQNTMFELPVLFNEWGAKQLDNGYEGFLPNCLDTVFEASYVDENSKLGLKERSLSTLGYQQETYEQVTMITAAPGELPPGGRFVRETYLTHQVATGKFEEIAQFDPETNFPLAPLQGSEIYKTEVVMVPTGRQIEVVKRGKTTMEDEMEPVVESVTRQYKMHELSAQHVLAYGADDTICTAALHNYYRLFMELESTWQLYLDVEIAAAYQHAKNFVDGCDISIEKINQLSAEDDITYNTAWAKLRSFLIEKGWDGVHPPVYTKDITPAQIKEAYTIVTGQVLDTLMRIPAKIIVFIEKVAEQPVFAAKLAALIEGDEAGFNEYVQSFFTGEPKFNDGSVIQMQKLLYDVIGLPVKLRNPVSATAKAAGETQGSPKTDALAIDYAIMDCDKTINDCQAELADADTAEVLRPTLQMKAAEANLQKDLLQALKLMAMVGTRRSLYYSKYPAFPHWKDGKVRSSHRQSSTNTRRASEAGPNKQQMPKHMKIEGQEAKFREVVVPHRPDAVIVSMDFAAQELRVIADYSHDPEMLACFIGENKKDMHAITGVGIANRMHPEVMWNYDMLMEILHDGPGHQYYKWAKAARNLGKKTNFTTEYGAAKAKLAQTLMVPEDDAQAFIDAKEASFPVAYQWKQSVIADARRVGYVKTKLGGVRHLRAALTSDDKWEASKAERQAVNFEIQGSCAEMTKLAEGRMWKARLSYLFDAVCIGPIHDEVVWSVRICDLHKFIPAMHACMIQNYADMYVPIESSISFGKDFYNQIEIGDQPTAEAIDFGLQQLGLNVVAAELGIKAKVFKFLEVTDEGLVNLMAVGTEPELEKFAEILNGDKVGDWEIHACSEFETEDPDKVALRATFHFGSAEVMRKLKYYTTSTAEAVTN